MSSDSKDDNGYELEGVEYVEVYSKSFWFKTSMVVVHCKCSSYIHVGDPKFTLSIKILDSTSPNIGH